jgi:histidinol dehydrogenase
MLPLRSLDELSKPAAPELEIETRTAARVILDDVAGRGEVAVREHSERFGDLEPGAPLWLGKSELQAAAERLPTDQLALLQRTAERIRRFAEAQRDSFGSFEFPLPGGFAKQRWVPLDAAGCYAPGGRYPLPSSVLMTAVTARAAGVPRVVVASPKPGDVTLAAAWVAGADRLLAAGGAQAIGALAYGIGGEPGVDVIVGPGNRYVTAAKALVSERVAIDMLAGPSELLVVAGSDADPAWIAADLLAQAEHDPDARPLLIALDAELIPQVNAELEAQLANLGTRDVARRALANGGAWLAPDEAAAVAAVDRLAPEHLELPGARAGRLADRVRHFGALFTGRAGGEVFGDYGAGPNHVLPTGGSARRAQGLSVLDFLRLRVQLHLDDLEQAAPLREDAAELAALEGLAAHAEAARRRALP